MFNPVYALEVINQQVKSGKALLAGDDASNARRSDGSFICDGWEVKPYTVGGSPGVFVKKTTGTGVVYRRAHLICSGTILLGQENDRYEVMIKRTSELSAVAQFGIHSVRSVSPNREYKVPWRTFLDSDQAYIIIVSDGRVDARINPTEKKEMGYEVSDATWAVQAGYTYREGQDATRVVVLYTDQDPSALETELSQYLDEHDMTDFADILDLWPEIAENATT